MSRMRGAVSVFGRSRRDYGHFHGRLLLRGPLPPSTAKNSLDRSARLILHFGPRPRLTCMSRPACLGIGTTPSWRTSCRLGEALSQLSAYSQMQKVRGSNPAPASHRAAAGQRSSYIAKPATPKHQQSQGTYAEPGRARKKQNQPRWAI